MVAEYTTETGKVTWHNDAWKAANPDAANGYLPASDPGNGRLIVAVPAAAYHRGTARIETRNDPSAPYPWFGVPAATLILNATNRTCSYSEYHVHQGQTSNASGRGDTRIRIEALRGVDYYYVAVPATQPWPTSRAGGIGVPRAKAGELWRVLDLPAPSTPMRVTVFPVARNGATLADATPKQLSVDGRKLAQLPSVGTGGAPRGRPGAVLVNLVDRTWRNAPAFDVYCRLTGLPAGATFTPDPALKGDLAGFRRAKLETIPGPQFTGLFIPSQGALTMDYRVVLHDGYRPAPETRPEDFPTKGTLTFPRP